MHATAFEDRATCSVILVNAEAEQRLLGAILIDNKSFHRVSGLIRADHFSNGLHARIFEGVAHLIATGTAANPVTLSRICSIRTTL
jgi:replicative DNA helicase